MTPSQNHNPHITVKTKGSFFKRMLKAHSGIGLSIGVLMYVLCLTGTLAVFYPELERWEQPHIAEYTNFSPAAMSQAKQAFYERVPDSTANLYIVLPTQRLPRAHISDGETEFWLNQDGSLADPVSAPWTHMLTELHINLHLPQVVGLFIVGVLGVMLLAAIISGTLAHKRIFKDAFKLRIGGSKQAEQIDLHNRLSVWALPFHIVIAITGAFFGVVSLLILLATSIFYQGDKAALLADIYGGDPMITAHEQEINFSETFKTLTEIAPESSPIYLVINQPTSHKAYMEVAALPQHRLIYSEMYRFNTKGEYLDHQGFSDGPFSRQLIYSVYRIHFGDFGGLPVQIAFFLLGLSLTVISVTGINIWLNKRNYHSKLNQLWSGFVWGFPIALTISAAISLFVNIPPITVALSSLLLCLTLSYFQKNYQRCNERLTLILTISLSLLVACYFLSFTDNVLSPASRIINLQVFFWLLVSVFIYKRYQHEHKGLT